MRKRIFKIFLWLFGFDHKKKQEEKNGTLIILIDGLSFDALHYAIKKGYCPTLHELSKNQFSLNKYFCGLPASTTATEAMLFYGTNYNIPGFTWYDRKLKKFVRGNRSKELTEFEDAFTKKRNLLRDGSVIMGVYSGGATELSLSGRNLTFSRSLYLLKTAHYFLMALLYPMQLIRALYLVSKTLLLYNKSNHLRSEETLSQIILGQFSCFLTEVEIMRNTKKIFVDFLLYDEYAHEYGPTHQSTLTALRLIDRYIKRIIRTANNADRLYDLILLSDHGQTESIPYDKERDQSIIDITNSLHNKDYIVMKTMGGFTPDRKKKELYVVPAGSTLQLYFSPYLEKTLFENEINTLFPTFISTLLTYDAFGWLLVKRDNHSSMLYGKRGSVLFIENKPYVLSGTLFSFMNTEEINDTLSSFQYYSTFTNNGDLTLFGNVTSDKKVYGFEKNRGNHGGFYGPMVYPFYMSKNKKITGRSMNALFDTIALDL